VFEIGLNRAVILLAQPKTGRGGRASAKAEVLKAVGEHPTEGGKIEVLSGRYGAYVKHGKINATLPKGVEPKDVTLEQAVELIAARAAKGPSKGRGGFKKGGAKATGSGAKKGKVKATAEAEDGG